MTNIISNPKYKGFYLQNGYKLVKVDYHPKSNKRGYVSEHRLVVEKNIGRYLKDDEVIHHVNGIRDDNRIENLEIKTNNSTHITEHSFKRNNNGQIVANEPIFQKLKFRLYDKDRDITQIYSLSKLIGTTFRRGKFQFRGRFTGLKDATGKEIYEGDIILFRDIKHKVVFIDQHNNDGYTLNPTMLFFGLELEPSKQNREDKLLYVQTFDWDDQEYYKVSGNIYENPGLFESDSK